MLEPGCAVSSVDSSAETGTALLVSSSTACGFVSGAAVAVVKVWALGWDFVAVIGLPVNGFPPFAPLTLSPKDFIRTGMNGSKAVARSMGDRRCDSLLNLLMRSLKVLLSKAGAVNAGMGAMRTNGADFDKSA